MHGEHETTFDVFSTASILLYGFPFLLISLYLVGVLISNKKYKKWPIYRMVFWIGGVSSISFAFIGPIADLAHSNFQAHMLIHLLLGMLGPLLIAISSPIRLLLRTVPVKHARTITKLLKSPFAHGVTHPICAAVLNIGGLWLLYTSDLYSAMHNSLLVYILVHLHVFLAGYVFTISLIYIDPLPYRTSFRLRAIVLILSMAGHSILSKWIYANPPVGTQPIEAQKGGMLMYYGGDAIDLMLVILLCYQYYKGSRRVPKKETVLIT